MKTLYPALAIGVTLVSVYLAQFGAAAPQSSPNGTRIAKPARSSKTTDVRHLQLIGDWYMGTMSGFDCNLRITSPNTLSVQYGGCFHQDPPLKTQWKLQGDKVQLQNRALHNSLGKSLRIAHYKSHIVLMPERSELPQGQHKYSYTRCFWRNLMKDGLQLSKDAPR